MLRQNYVLTRASLSNKMRRGFEEMPMKRFRGKGVAENKTKPTKVSVDAFIDSLPEPRRDDARELVKLMKSVSRNEPTMWGPSLIGFGTYHYRYESGREGDMPLLCFSPRKSANVVYIRLTDKDLLDKLGKHTLRGDCLHIKKLSDIDREGSEDDHGQLVHKDACAGLEVALDT